MDKDQLTTAAILAVVLIGIPMGILIAVCRASEPKDDLKDRENYPDDLFI